MMITGPLRGKLRHLTQADEGQALVLTSVVLIVMMVMAGLGVDAGYLRYQKQQMQKAADAGAMAAAAALIYGGNSADYTAAAKNDTSANGFTDGTRNTVVNVYYPPTSDGNSFAGNSGYVEVKVSQPQPTFFMKLAGFRTMPVSARAIVGLGSADGCIYVLDRAVSSAYKAAGGAQVTSACGILDNSGASGAYDDSGSACTTASHIGVVGTLGNNACSNPTPITGISHFTDPLSQLTAPTVGPIPQSCTYKNLQITSNTALTRGTYCGGIKITSNAKVTFGPGLYILYGGGLSVQSGSTINGTGVTFYNTGTANGAYAFTPISINGVSNSTLTAPTTSDSTTGAIAGVLFFEDRNPQGTGNNVNVINGGSNTNFVGALYFKTSQLQYAGGTNAAAYTIIVADTLTFVGNTIINDTYTDLPGGHSLIQTSTLAE